MRSLQNAAVGYACPLNDVSSYQKEIEYEAEDHSGVSLSAEARAILDGYVPQTGEPACRHPRLAREPLATGSAPLAGPRTRRAWTPSRRG